MRSKTNIASYAETSQYTSKRAGRAHAYLREIVVLRGGSPQVRSRIVAIGHNNLLHSGSIGG
jgi:hypothetical protein